MGNPAYLVDNILLPTTPMTWGAGLDDTQDEGALVDGIMGNVVQIDATVAGVKIWWDMVSSRAPDMAALFNVTGSSAVTYELLVGPTADPPAVATITYRDLDMRLDADGAYQGRYFGFGFRGAVETFDVGEAVLGNPIELTGQYARGFIVETVEDDIDFTAQYGDPRSQNLFEYTVFKYTFPALRQSEFDELTALHTATRGRTPFVWIPDSDKPDVWLVTRESGREPVAISQNHWSDTLTLRSLARGVRVTF